MGHVSGRLVNARGKQLIDFIGVGMEKLTASRSLSIHFIGVAALQEPTHHDPAGNAMAGF
jgi:hypothetical protein